MSEYLSADDIWAAKDIEERDVSVPQWPRADGSPGKVRIRTFSKKQADKMRKDSTGPNPNKPGRPVEVDTDELEARLFTEGVIEPKFAFEDYERLQEKSAVAIGIILKAIMDASGLSDLAVSEADKSNGARPDAALRVLPRKRTKDDASGTTAEDVGQ
jgi:hypothetical protein